MFSLIGIHWKCTAEALLMSTQNQKKKKKKKKKKKNIENSTKYPRFIIKYSVLTSHLVFNL